MMAAQVSINVYEQFKVLQGEIFHPFGCILKPVMGGANLRALGPLLKNIQVERVAATNTVMRNAAQLCQFCNEKLTVLGSDEHKKILNR